MSKVFLLQNGFHTGILHFLFLSYVYVPSLISIPFVLFKIWPGEGNNMETKWLRGDYSVNIQSRIMFAVHCPSSLCHLSINQVSFQALLYLPRYGPDRQQL